MAGHLSMPFGGPYNATKHAVTSIAETLFSELQEAGSKVRVSCLCPGAVATNIGDSARNRPKELANEGAEPADMGDLTEFAETFEGFARKPAEVAERVLAAVLEDRFWIETDEFYRQPIRDRHRAIEERTDPPARGSALGVYGEN